ncbi:hypothetical protein BLOT_009864 [Blomia tropicalis]|nr:hypothetical protein BLOT_009864 [Blomia tropicalis]
MSCNPDSTVSSNFEFLNSTFQLLNVHLVKIQSFMLLNTQTQYRKENVQQLSNKERRVLKQIEFNRLHQKRVDQAVFNLMKTINHYIMSSENINNCRRQLNINKVVSSHHKSALDAKEKQTWQLSIANDQTWEIWSENNQLVKICKNPTDCDSKSCNPKCTRF